MAERQARKFVGFRVGVSGLAAVDGEAALAGVTRSQMIRLFMALGMERWREGTPAQRKVWLALLKVGSPVTTG